MKIKGNHPLAEVIAKCMHGIEQVPKEYQRRMINRACKKAIEWHEKQNDYSEIIEAMQTTLEILPCKNCEAVNTIKCVENKKCLNKVFEKFIKEHETVK